jgi:Ran GTPase-activating protein (RanGAP) involved in mRNA processing and transport
VAAIDGNYRGLTPEDLGGLLASLTDEVDEFLLEGNRLGDAGCEELVRLIGNQAEVRVLNLADNRISAAGIRILVAAERLRPIELYLDENPLHDEGVVALAASAFVQRVRYLGLSCTGLDDEGVEALVASPYLAACETVDLTQTQLSARSWRRLAERFKVVR